MTSPPLSETGPSPESLAREVRDKWLASPIPEYEGSGAVSVVSINAAVFPMLDALIADAIRAERREAHLQDARAGCRYCRNRNAIVIDDTPVHDGEQWVHLRRADLQPWESCERGEVWDALSLLSPKGTK